MRRIIIILVVMLFSSFLYAQQATITLEWDLFGENELMGFLVLPQAGSEPCEILRGNIPSFSRDKSAQVVTPEETFDKAKQVWKINQFTSGVYQFYVTGAFSADEFEENSISWDSSIRVKVTMGNKVVNTIKSPDEEGNVWHVCDILGSTGTIIEVNEILPRMRTVYGEVMNAVTGEMLKSVLIKLKNPKTSEVLEQCTTDENGNYLFSVPIGHYEVSFNKDEYIGYSVPVEMWQHEIPVRIDGHLSPVLKNVERRIVLSWGKYPRDLDAHLVGPKPLSNGTFHVSYRNMRVFNNQHFLDRDDVSSYGPETITLKKIDPGVYTYYVHDYTNRSKNNSDALSHSSAVVRIYEKDRLIEEYRIPENITGTNWNVIEIDGKTGKITFLNSFN